MTGATPRAGPAGVCVYLILSHTQPDGVVRLARTILRQSPTARVLVHHDAASGAFATAAFEPPERFALVADPVRVRWGTFSQVEAVLRALRQLSARGTAFDWVCVISGQDYPARPIAEFEQMLCGCGVDALMTYDRIGPADRHLHDRYEFAYRRILAGPLPRLLRTRQAYDTVLNRVQPFWRIQTDTRGTFIGSRLRRSIFKLPLTVYKGWSWWALSATGVASVLRTITDQPEIVARFRPTLSPDEAFFQTIVLNAGLRARNVALHYADWSQNNASPPFLTIDDLAAIVRSGQWFARKVNVERDAALCDALDALTASAVID